MHVLTDVVDGKKQMRLEYFTFLSIIAACKNVLQKIKVKAIPEVRIRPVSVQGFSLKD